MTKAEKLQYLQDCVAGQGTQAGLSIATLLEEIINGNDDVFEVNVEDNEAVAGGSYALTLSKEAGQSKVVYTAG